MMDEEHSQNGPTIEVGGGKRTGRWEDDEHQKFLEGCYLHGRDWKKIAEHVPTRESSQVRSHAQKYFHKQEQDRLKIGHNPDILKEELRPRETRRKSKVEIKLMKEKEKNQDAMHSEEDENAHSANKSSKDKSNEIKEASKEKKRNQQIEIKPKSTPNKAPDPLRFSQTSINSPPETQIISYSLPPATSPSFFMQYIYPAIEHQLKRSTEINILPEVPKSRSMHKIEEKGMQKCFRLTH